MDLATFVNVLIRRWWVTLVCALIGLAIAAALAMSSPSVYQSSTTLLLTTESESGSTTIASENSASLQALPTVLDLAYSDSVLASAAEEIDTTPAALRTQLSAENSTGSLLFTLTVNGDSPENAQAGATAIRDSLNDVVEDSFSTEGETGNDHLTLTTVNEPTVSNDQVAPHTSRMAFSGLLLGAILGVAGAFLLEARSARKPSEQTVEN